MKMHLTIFLSNLLPFSLGTCINASKPNTLRCESEGFLPNHTSCKVMSTSVDEGDIFNRYFVVLIASSYNSCVNPTLMRMFLALFINVVFILFETPFCCGVYNVVFLRVMPQCWHNCSKSFPPNSPPLSILSTLILLSF
jgi:hypothetical protein